MDNASDDGIQTDIVQTIPIPSEISRMRVFVACENIKSLGRQIDTARDEADRGLLTRMLWAEKENLEMATAALQRLVDAERRDKANQGTPRPGGILPQFHKPGNLPGGA